MADLKITQLTELTTAPANTDILPFVDDPGGSPATKKITVGNLMGGLIAPQGFLINGKIVPSVASNNLTVAIKGIDGNDPSATNPVYVRLGDTVRSITAACSVTKNAGTKWLNAGSAELATKEIDYFVYLIWYSTHNGGARVVPGFARIPWVERYDGFNNTNGELENSWCYEYDGVGQPDSADPVSVVGRFAATLSAGAGYTWSVPTFTTVNLIQRPIYETRELSYAPVAGGGSGNGTWDCTYKLVGNVMFLNIVNSVEVPSNANTFTLTMPFQAKLSRIGYPTYIQDNSSLSATPGHIETAAGSATLNIYKAFFRTVWTSSNNKAIYPPILTILI